MEFFKQVDIHWMSKAKFFFSLSGLLLLIGIVAYIHNGGLSYGIDFKGGTLVTIRFAQAPNVDSIRHDMEAQGITQSSIQTIHDPASPNTHDVEIGLQETGTGTQALDAAESTIIAALQHSFPAADPTKKDFNTATAADFADYLVSKDPLGLSTSAGNRYSQLGQQVADFRNKDKGGLLTSMADLNGSGLPSQVVTSLQNSYYAGPFAVRDDAIVGPKVGAELKRQAVYVTLYALAGMLVYIAIRFEWIYGVAAVVAVFHDVLITLGLFSLFHQYFEISMTVIAALLTLVGYSMNDTIVIFDRVRENNRLMRREPFPDIVNRSINQTLSRTILTSGLTFLTVLVLFLMGGPVLRSFSFALVIGIVVGTYSSFGIAAPMVVAWNRWRGTNAGVSTGSAAGNRPGPAKRATA